MAKAVRVINNYVTVSCFIAVTCFHLKCILQPTYSQVGKWAKQTHYKMEVIEYCDKLKANKQM